MPAARDSTRLPVRRAVWGGMLLVGIVGVAACGRSQAPASTRDEPTVRLPAGLEPFAHLTGKWAGVGVPPKARLKGWRETHEWSIVFGADGAPEALAVTMTGNKRMKRGELRASQPEAGTFVYRFEAADANGSVVPYIGAFDAEASPPTLTLESSGAGKLRSRLVLRVLSNGEGYTLWDEKQGAGGRAYLREVETRMSRPKEERVADDGPKCIITGGGAALTVSYEGRSYPVCCTGCREQFLAEPERFLARLAKRGADPAPAAAPAGSEPAPDVAPMPSRPKTDAKSKAKRKPAKRPADLLAEAKKAERDGKRGVAMSVYREILATFPRSSEAKTAGERLGVLEGK